MGAAAHFTTWRLDSGAGQTRSRQFGHDLRLNNILLFAPHYTTSTAGASTSANLICHVERTLQLRTKTPCSTCMHFLVMFSVYAPFG